MTRRRDQQKQHGMEWKCILDVCYDGGIFLLSMIDTISDMMITIQWYHNGNTIFFVFCIKCFLCVLPFGQFVPLFIWFQSYQFRWINNLLMECNLQPQGKASSTSTDPAENFLEQKLKIHGGFLIESIVEAVPMSILQMIFLVTTDGITSLYLFSVIISMISVASNGLPFAYSIDHPTFIFNFVCFVADVFNIFVTVSWLFYNNGSGDNTYQFFLFSQPINPLNAIWFYKEMILILSFATLALLALVAFAFNIYDHYHTGKKLRLICYSILLIVFLICLFPCLMIIIESLKFSIFPFCILKIIDHQHSSHHNIYQHAFTWVNGGKGKNEFLHRSRLINQYLATTFLKQYLPSSEDGSQRIRMRSCARRLQNISESEYTLAIVREAAGYTWKNIVYGYTSIIQQEIKQYSSDAHHYHRDLVWTKRFEIICYTFILYAIFPMLFINVIFSILYPCIIFIQTYTTTNATIGSLQLVLSFHYFVTLIILLVLSPSVYQFTRTISHIIFYSKHDCIQEGLDDVWMDQIIYVYQYEKNVIYVRDTLNNDIKMIPELTEICMSYIPNANQQQQDDFGDEASVRAIQADKTQTAKMKKATTTISHRNRNRNKSI